jgi:molecular chaperone HtpG
MLITQSEFMRRMKEMSQFGGGGMSFYGDLPDSFNLVVNSNHEQVLKLAGEAEKALGEELSAVRKEVSELREQVEFLEKEHSSKKPEEIAQAEKDDLSELRKTLTEKESGMSAILASWGKESDLARQLTDLALLANNMLKGEELSAFIKRSVKLL